MSYWDDPLLAEGLDKIRKKFLKEFCQIADVKPRSCNNMSFFIFNYDSKETGDMAERGIMVVDFGKYNQRIIDVNGSLTEELTTEDTIQLKKIMPEIENQVNAKMGDGKFKIIEHNSTLRHISAHLDFVDWFCVIDIEMNDGYRESTVYPSNNKSLREWSALPEGKPKFLDWYSQKQKK